MFKHTLFAAVALAGASSFALPALAADYSVEPLKDGKTFMGCLAQNQDAGVGFLAVGNSVALFATSAKFGIAKGAAVKGTWSVDGAAPADFANPANSANVATIDVPNTAEAVTALTTGKALDVTANGKHVTFDLTGSGQAFSDLITCMSENGAS